MRKKYAADKKSGKANLAMGSGNNDCEYANAWMVANRPIYARMEWVLDSGATHHITGSMEHLHELEDCNLEVILGDGRKITAKQKGSIYIAIKTSSDPQIVQLVPIQLGIGQSTHRSWNSSVL